MGWSLVLHGLAHGVLASSPRPDVPGAAPWTVFTTHSWAFSALGAGAEAARLVGFILLLGAAAGFILTGLAVISLGGRAALRRWTGLGAAILSAALLVLFWHPLMGPGLVIDAIVMGGATVGWKLVKEIVSLPQ
jgi:hypothetical protein